MCLVSACAVQVEARTRWSDRFLFPKRPKIMGLSTKCQVPLDLPSSCQCLETMSLIGGFCGL